jgi:hypothetical protein
MRGNFTMPNQAPKLFNGDTSESDDEEFPTDMAYMLDENEDQYQIMRMGHKARINFQNPENKRKGITQLLDEAAN